MSLIAGKQIRDRAITSAKVDGSVLSTDGTNTPPGSPYDALAQRIVNAADPINPQDLVTLAYLTAYVGALLNTGATRVSSVGFVTNYVIAAARQLVDCTVEIAAQMQGVNGVLYVQIFDAAALPANGTQSLYCWPVNELDRFTYTPEGREAYSSGFVVALSTTDRTLTISSEAVMKTTVRYFP